MVLKPALTSALLTATGTVLAERQVDVQTEIAGRVIRIGFPEGGRVAAGQVLVELDDAELRAQLEKAAAQLHLAQILENRAREQAGTGAVSRQEYEQAAAQLESARSDAALIRARWEQTRIRAPFSGRAGLRRVDLGAVLQPGTRVTTLQDLGSLRVEFFVPENQAPALRAGMPVRFIGAGVPDTQTASVYAIEPRVDPESRQVTVRARGGGDTRILPGAFARVVLPLSQDSALWVPAQAVVQSARGSMAWRVRGGKAELTPFAPGLRSPESVEAARGLSAGDTILISGLMQLRPGAPVTPVVSP